MGRGGARKEYKHRQNRARAWVICSQQDGCRGQARICSSPEEERGAVHTPSAATRQRRIISRGVFASPVASDSAAEAGERLRRRLPSARCATVMCYTWMPTATAVDSLNFPQLACDVALPDSMCQSTDSTTVGLLASQMGCDVRYAVLLSGTSETAPLSSMAAAKQRKTNPRAIWRPSSPCARIRAKRPRIHARSNE